MSSLVSYKGLQVLNSAPGAGGSAINSDLQDLADRIGPCNYTATTDPTSSDNESSDPPYNVGSRWMNQTAGTEWVCIASSTSTATWETTTISADLANYLPLSGGTLTGAVIDSVVILTDGSTINSNALLGNIFSVTLGGNRTMAAPTGGVDGQKAIWRIIQDATGGRTLTWDPVFNWGPGSAPTLSTTAGTTDYIGGIYNSTTSVWDMIASGNGLLGY